MQYSRRWFSGLALCSLLGAQTAARYYRIEKSGQTWFIVGPDGTAIGRIPQIGDDPRGVPFLEAIPLLERDAYTDVFATEIQEKIRSICGSRAKKFSERSELVAYIWTGLPIWNAGWADWYR